MPAADSRRSRLRTKASIAYAPAAISNFFRIVYSKSSGALVGATGGGYVLSAGAWARATYKPGDRAGITTIVNGDRYYNARTTRRAVEMLLADEDKYSGGILLVQNVETPIGSGFGASAASSVSATYAISAALGIRKPKKALALFPHRAEIIERTGLGTVSVVYDGLGAGAITSAGEPGVAKFKNVKVPGDIRIVTAHIAPYDKKDALSSRKISERINRLGHQALKAFLADPSLDSLALEGERFSHGLGLETPEVRKLVQTAKASGAMYASQNMIGYSVHAIVDADRSKKVAATLSSIGDGLRVDTFQIGKERARVMNSTRRKPGPSYTE